MKQMIFLATFLSLTISYIIIDYYLNSGKKKLGGAICAVEVFENIF